MPSLLIKQKQIKIIFTGSVGAGKTEAIRQLSEIPVVSTDTKYTEGNNSKDKKTTTVAMDYGQISLNSTEKLHLYGTPGQRRFDFMSEVLTKGGLALVILIDNSTPNPLTDLNYYLKLNENFLKNNPVVIAITHTDLLALPSLNNYQQFLAKKNLDYPVMKMDTRQREQVINVLEEVVNCLDSHQLKDFY
ncbi:MAG: GTP-binding protein [Methylococcaceae bacterium]|nr:GTP-binding protein [Methylococcaceae bacterium]